MASMASQICSHIASIFTKPTHPHPPVLDLLVAELSSVATRSGNVFFYGVGREGLMLKALCMRLAHLGFSAHLVFDMTTPPITANDLLIASAGSGGFSTVDAICSVARSHGARVLLLTAQPESWWVMCRRRLWRMTVGRRWNLGRCFQRGVCMRVLCLSCLRWWFTGWVRLCVRALRPYGPVTPIWNEVTSRNSNIFNFL